MFQGVDLSGPKTCEDGGALGDEFWNVIHKDEGPETGAVGVADRAWC